MTMPSAPTSSIAVQRPLAEPHLALLREVGSDRVPHSGRTLLAHLRGTHDMLAAWGNPGPVCLAGLFHSIYGTNAFRHRSLSLDARPRLRFAIGERAERLAYLFCTVDRPRALVEALNRGVTDLRAVAGGDEPVDGSELRALVEIECANLIEQGSRSGALRQLWCRAVDAPVRAAGRLLSPAGHAAVRSYLARLTATSPPRVTASGATMQ